MSHSLNSLGGYIGDYIGDIKGDTRSLAYGTDCQYVESSAGIVSNPI